MPPSIERDEYDKIRRVFVSAHTGAGMDLLRQAMSECVQLRAWSKSVAAEAALIESQEYLD